MRKTLRLLLVGNYPADRQFSMQHFCSMLAESLPQMGFSVEVVRPESVFGSNAAAHSFAAKWLGYLDKFLVFPFRLWKAARRADLVHICDHSNAMYGRWVGRKPWLVTCHDLLAVRSALGEVPKNPTGWSGRILQRWILGWLKTAPLVVSVSKHTQTELMRLTGRKQSSCRVVHNGLNGSYMPMPEEVRRPALEKVFGARVPKAYLLHIGADTWYKNRGAVADVFCLVAKRARVENLRLVMVGAKTAELEGKLRNAGLLDSAHFLHSLSSHELNALYSAASVFVFPSLAEGFGWPVLEAMAAGCPVACSGRAPLTEIGGDAADYFDPEDLHAAADKVSQLLEEPSEARSARVRKGLERAELFSGPRMVERYAEIYQGILADKNQNTL